MKKILGLLFSFMIAASTLTVLCEHDSSKICGAEIKGDVNEDGEFNILDAMLVQKYILNVPDIKLSNLKAADYSANGKIDVIDLILIKNALLEEFQDDTDINDPYSEINIGFRSIDEYKTMRQNITELSDDDFNKYALSIEGGTVRTRSDLEDFDKLISSLPLPVIEGSQIVWIDHETKINESTNERYDIAYISLSISSNEWVRFEYILSENDPKTYIDKLSSDESFSGTVYKNPLVLDDSQVFAESYDNVKGINTWYAVSNVTLVRAVYKSEISEHYDISDATGWLKIGTIDDYLN